MSVRTRAATTLSPSVGWFVNASPVGVHPVRPSSKSQLVPGVLGTVWASGASRTESGNTLSDSFGEGVDDCAGPRHVPLNIARPDSSSFGESILTAIHSPNVGGLNVQVVSTDFAASPSKFRV